jgi:hypothetical protein
VCRFCRIPAELDPGIAGSRDMRRDADSFLDLFSERISLDLESSKVGLGANSIGLCGFRLGTGEATRSDRGSSWSRPAHQRLAEG